MKIEGADITISQSSIFIVEAPDSVQSCLITIIKSKSGVKHPVIIKSGATFQKNIVTSEIPGPIWLDKKSGDCFLGVGDNYYRKEVPHARLEILSPI